MKNESLPPLHPKQRKDLEQEKKNERNRKAKEIRNGIKDTKKKKKLEKEQNGS
jgi:hypothetical protein